MTTSQTTDKTEITCDCTVCGGQKALIGGSGKVDGTDINGPTKKAAVMRHNLVRLAHSPLSRSASAKQFGPWPVG